MQDGVKMAESLWRNGIMSGIGTCCDVVLVPHFESNSMVPRDMEWRPVSQSDETTNHNRSR